MRAAKKIKKEKSPTVRIDPSLEQYRDKTLFPESLARANEMLKNAKIPGRSKTH